jgi:hypothetical protein
LDSGFARGERGDEGDLDGGIGEGRDGTQAMRGLTWWLRKFSEAPASRSATQRASEREK